MAQGNTVEALGKKVFFLYPAALVLNEVVEELIQEEYEVYVIKDHEKLKKIITKYPGSVVLVNISEQLSEREWETWIRAIMADPVTAKVDIGILAPNGDEDLKRKYVNSVKVNCGYIQVKSDSKLLIKQVLATLIAVNTKGQRKYIRAAPSSETMTTINLPINGDFIKGSIKDISTMGLSCIFDQDPELEKNSLCQNVQIKLQSVLLKVEGIVFGYRDDGVTKTYVIVFTQRTDPAVRTKIRKFVQGSMQAKLDAEFK
ncbi:PilZ domain-containing protein [Treponema primitia]|uniref:PilZ domain-containing protein n=1 Tax=Treponema primitia TaxID=88058 RepID=UPI0002555382|nr:PilZ domain-containing protein [Treponema primitia]